VETNLLASKKKSILHCGKVDDELSFDMASRTRSPLRSDQVSDHARLYCACALQGEGCNGNEGSNA